MTTTLRIQHRVPGFEAWKRAFDADPMDRKGSGVIRFQVHRGVADPDFVTIDLELAGRAQAEALLARLRALWSGPAKALFQNAEAAILEQVESRELGSGEIRER